MFLKHTVLPKVVNASSVRGLRVLVHRILGFERMPFMLTLLITKLSTLSQEAKAVHEIKSKTLQQIL